MPFRKVEHYSLALAISAAIWSQQGLAASSSSEPEFGWSCSMTAGGDWDCEVGEVQTAPEPKLPEPAEQTETVATDPSPAEQPATAATPNVAPIESNSGESAIISDAPPAQPAPAPVITASGAQEQAEQRALAESSTPTPGRPPAATTQSYTGARQYDAWNCTPTADGSSWDCSGNPAAQSTQFATTQAQRNTAVAARPEHECTANADGTWECVTKQPIGTYNPAIVAGNSRQQQTANKYAYLDWYPYQPGEHKGYCRGRYIQPTFADIDPNTPIGSLPLYVDADESESELGNLTRLRGGVKLDQGNRQLRSDYAELDQVTNQLRLEGNVTFREPGMLMVGNRAQSNLTNNQTILNDAEYVLHERHLRGQADTVIRTDSGIVRIEEGSYTHCAPGDNSWQLNGESITLNQAEGYGEAEDVTLEIAGIPVFYLPYFQFPIDDRRKSGFLTPSIGYSEGDGADIAAPYYFNLAPHYDDTLTARIVSKRGLMLENEFRYMNEWSHNVLSTAYMPDDDKTGEDRWLLGLDHEGTFGDRLETDIDFTRVSDNDYFKDLSPTNLERARESHLNQRGQAVYHGDNYTASLLIHDYQTIDDDSTAPYQKKPQLRVTGSRDDLIENAELTYQAEFTKFERDLDGLTGSARVIGDRTHLRPGINATWENTWGFIKPSLELWHSSYSLENQLSGLDTAPTINAPILSIDSGLIFERELEIGSNGYTQTLEPRLFYLYVPEEDQTEVPNFDSSDIDFSYASLFYRNRFTGKDRIGDTNQMSLGVTSRFYEEDGSERARLAIGQAYYLEDRIVGLNGNINDDSSQSNIAAEASWNINRNTRFTYDAEVSHADFGMVEQNYKLFYRSDKHDGIFYAGYREREDTRQQTDIGFRAPVSNQWNILAHWQQDLREEHLVDALFGVEYKNCCWQLRLSARKWRLDDGEYDKGIFLHFILRGLGGFGSDSGSDFIDLITGYDEEKENEF